MDARVSLKSIAIGWAGGMLRLQIPIESDEDRKALLDVVMSARAAELLKHHYVARRAAREGGRRPPASELGLPESVRRRLALLDALAKALADAKPAALNPVAATAEAGPAGGSPEG